MASTCQHGLEEAEARAGAHSEKLGGRHGQDRRGRHKHRDHGDRKDKHKDKNQDPDKPRGGTSGGNRNVAIYVHNYRSVPMQVQGWQFDHYSDSTGRGTEMFAVPSGWSWSTLPARASDGSHSSKSFICTRDRDNPEPRVVIVQIGTDRIVWGFNEPFWWPRGEIRTGSWSSDGWVSGGQLLGSEFMFVRESFSKRRDQGHTSRRHG